jgi:hypothetical protein
MNNHPLDINPSEQKLKIRLARIYSDFFSPPSVYAIFAFVVAWSDLPFWKGTFHAAIFGLLTSLTPLIYIISQMKRGLLEDIHISTSKQRKIPYLLGIVGAVIAYLILWLFSSSTIFLGFILAVIIGLTALGIINQKWLISAHSASIAAVTAFSGYAFNLTTAILLSPLILLTVLIRYFLKRHSIGELLSGVLLGIVVVVVLGYLGVL